MTLSHLLLCPLLPPAILPFHIHQTFKKQYNTCTPLHLAQHMPYYQYYSFQADS